MKINNYFENISQEFRLKNIKWNKKLLPWRNRAKWINEYKVQKGLCNSKLYQTLSYSTFYNYWMYFNLCFASLVGIPIGITSCAIGLKICTIAAGIKKYKSIIMRKKKKHDKIVLLAKSTSNHTEVFISKSLIDLNISHDEFVLMNNVPKEYDKMKEGIKNLKI